MARSGRDCNYLFTSSRLRQAEDGFRFNERLSTHHDAHADSGPVVKVDDVLVHHADAA